MGKVLFQTIEFGRGSQWAVGRGHLLTFTARGNLELWKIPELSLVWESGTSGKGAKLIMQGDGNLVIYDDDDESVWASGTFGHERALLSVEDDGRLVIDARNGRIIRFVPAYRMGAGFNDDLDLSVVPGPSSALPSWTL